MTDCFVLNTAMCCCTGLGMSFIDCCGLVDLLLMYFSVLACTFGVLECFAFVCYFRVLCLIFGFGSWAFCLLICYTFWYVGLQWFFVLDVDLDLKLIVCWVLVLNFAFVDLRRLVLVDCLFGFCLIDLFMCDVCVGFLVYILTVWFELEIVGVVLLWCAWVVCWHDDFTSCFDLDFLYSLIVGVRLLCDFGFNLCCFFLFD